MVNKGKKINLAYLAGILDGEGCITITKHRKDSYKLGWQYQLHVTVNNSNKQICPLFKKYFGGSIHIYSSPLRTKMYEWHAAARIALKVLQDLLPYLRIKKRQAIIAIKFQEQRITGGKTGYAGKNKVYFMIQEIQRKKLKDLKLPTKYV